MIHVREIMSRDVVHVAPSTTIREAAGLMARYDIGALPVCDGRRMVGMVTDRDLAVRALAVGAAPDTAVEEVATATVEWCCEDDDVDLVQQRMADAQVRRVPVVNEARELVGTLSLGDIATRADGASRDEVANTLEGVSQPVSGPVSQPR
ncbi:CBS domain-containing protein [Paraburkholderia caballeronis]|uniref:CBS domain-containing protein n=1 Tax=Paraburkholderia caballeronis TaxID=416943 RepID=UPI00106535F0|nr:CBS domain-containing protein [Paraburkholderia caballeronis]TDV21069.1 CBS domain-containing protein [Paraburkholderia caballeronis]TDV21498.1 CBS domain-containing protein [Paraburkholderia caballeronis]TDV33537.1 CBS domain-containing protein [Paraburkholderia caballeronis]